MKPTPTIRTAEGRPEEITRTAAAALLREERRTGRIITLRMEPGHILVSKERLLVCPKPEKPVPPPPPFSLSKRLTHKYNQGYAGLDKWHHIGEAQIVASGKEREDDECFRCLHIVEVKSGGRYRPANIMEALRDTMSFACRCEHDCCGHFFGGPSRIRPLCGNRYAVLVSGYRNI